jgi:hypothetical protein
MDEHRFDALAKALASATTRRRLVRGLLGGSAGAVVATRLTGTLPGSAAQPTTPATAPATVPMTVPATEQATAPVTVPATAPATATLPAPVTATAPTTMPPTAPATAPATPAAAPQLCPYGPQQCLPGYVWRVAKPDDLVCVTPEERDRVADDNAHAAERVDPSCRGTLRTPCPYGPSQCLPGYVWRDAWDGDAVCVTPDQRDQAHADNAHAQERIDPACATASACVDAQCPDNQACQHGACAPLACPPFLAAIGHRCQDPCTNWQGHCPTATDPSPHNCNCLTNAAGEALCLTGAAAGFGFPEGCTSDAQCQAAAQTRGASAGDWQCLHRSVSEPIQFCYRDPEFCQGDWSLL